MKRPELPFAGMDPATLTVVDGSVSAVDGPAVPVADCLRSMPLDALNFVVTSTGADADGPVSQSFGAHFCEVEVDEAIGRATVVRWVAVMDCGRVLNPKLARNQVMGGITFGLGMALLEQVPYDTHTAQLIGEYYLPTHADRPEFDISFVDVPDYALDPIGVRGIGEIGTCGVPAAIANAIFHATGKRLRDLPITLENLMAPFDRGRLPMSEHVITLRVNGSTRTVIADVRSTLLDLLRERLHLTGTKKGCDHGLCGACTVSVDGERVVSCLTLAASIDGCEVLTIEGIGTEAEPPSPAGGVPRARRLPMRLLHSRADLVGARDAAGARPRRPVDGVVRVWPRDGVRRTGDPDRRRDPRAHGGQHLSMRGLRQHRRRDRLAWPKGARHEDIRVRSTPPPSTTPSAASSRPAASTTRAAPTCWI